MRQHSFRMLASVCAAITLPVQCFAQENDIQAAADLLATHRPVMILFEEEAGTAVFSHDEATNEVPFQGKSSGQ
jgi:hypothetical protein